VRYRACLFDFGHTLFDTVPIEHHIESFSRTHDSDVGVDVFRRVWHEVREASRRPEELAKGRDLDPVMHRACWLELLRPLDALSAGLAEFVYESESSPAGWRPYPDARTVLERLRAAGVAIGVVSDTGWDIRRVFERFDLDNLIDEFHLSCDHGVCKPDPSIFRSACASLGVAPSETVMVGDNWVTDGGAAAIGITTLILPARDRTAEPALGMALALLSSPDEPGQLP